MILYRSDEQIEALNEKVRPLVKKGFFGRLCYTTLTKADADYRYENSVGVAKNLKKLRTVDIRVPTRGYNCDVTITPKIVLGQLTNNELKDVTNYYVHVQYPGENIIEMFTSDYIDAKVVLYGQRTPAKESKSKSK